MYKWDEYQEDEPEKVEVKIASGETIVFDELKEETEKNDVNIEKIEEKEKEKKRKQELLNENTVVCVTYVDKKKGEHKIELSTKFTQLGVWHTQLIVDGIDAPAFTHIKSLDKTDDDRDSGIVPYLKEILHIGKPAAKLIMVSVVKNAAQYSEKFEEIRTIAREKAESDRLARLEAEADRIQQKITSDRPKQLRGCHIPNGYEIWTGEKCHACGETIMITYVKDAPVPVTIMSCQAMVTGFYESCDNDDKMVEIQFTTPDTLNGGYKWQTIHTKSHNIRTKEGFKKEIMPKGLSVLEKNIGHVIDYFDECIKVNRGREGTVFKQGSACQTTGWTDNTFTAFKYGGVLLRDVDGKCIVEESVCTNDELVEKLASLGTLNGWVSAINHIAEFYRVRFVMYDALGSILLRFLKISPHAGMIIHDTGEGKTTSLQVIASMYGNPDEYGEGVICCGDISITGVNAFMHMYMDLPTLFDETTNSSEKFRKSFNYIVGNAAAPVRGKQDGELRDRNNHMSNSYVAAEESMAPPSMNDGGNSRGLPFYERFIPGGNEAKVRAAKNGLTDNYGFILPLFIGMIYKHRDNIRVAYEAAKARLVAKTGNDRVKRQAPIFAAAQVSGMLLENIFKKIGVVAPLMSVEQIVDEMWAECTEINAEEPMPVKALRHFHSWYIENFNVAGLTNDCRIEWTTNVKGDMLKQKLKRNSIYLWQEDLFIDFLKDVFDKELTRAGYTNLNGIYKYWRDVLKITEYKTEFKKDNKVVKRMTIPVHHYKSIDSEDKTQFHVIRIITEKMHEVLGLDKPTFTPHINKQEAEKDEMGYSETYQETDKEKSDYSDDW